MESLKVMIADDSYIYATGLRKFLEEELLLQFCGRAANGEEAIALAARVKPDVVIMDIQMPVLNGVDATRQILQKQPTLKVLALTMYTHEFSIVDMMEAGAAGYVDKLDSDQYLGEAIRTVQKGLTYFCPSTNTRLARLLVASKANLVLNPIRFTAEERQLIQLLCEERTIKEVAYLLKVSESTIERHLKKLQEKMGVKSSVGIIFHAARLGLI